MIHVVNAGSADYVPHTAAMLHSLFAANPGEKFAVSFLHRQAGFPGVALRQLESLCRRHGAAFSPVAVPAQRLEGLPIEGRFPQEAWYRVFLPQLLPGVERALWLDADVIVLGPVRELWDLDLQGLPLAACPNACLYTITDVIRGIGVEDRRLYFNSGVMLLDLKRLRDEGSEDALRAAATQHRQWIRFADQDVLNAVYHRRYLRLALSWNVLAHAHVNVPETLRVHGVDEYREAMAHPRIVHFTGLSAMKPWFWRCSHPRRADYLRHRALAGWPAPDYPDRTLRASIMRQFPLRWRAVATTLLAGRYSEAMSYLRPW